jgi:glycosyltransferase involved in cell wall biosynthesis
MNLLVVTQAVDQDDLALGFFHRWIEDLASRFESIEVICLKEGKHALPANVRVHSLGKEHGTRSRLAYAIRFKLLAWRLRSRYDAVFVHMNEEYVLIAGPLWKLLGKRVVLWRNHKMGSFATRVAVALADAVCYTSPESFTARSPKARRMPVGIDTEQFKPAEVQPSSDTLLFLGRLDVVKRVTVFVEALVALSKQGVGVRADLYGSPTEPGSAYAASVREKAAQLPSEVLTLHPGVSHKDIPALYRSHAVYANLTPSGSFDKTILEAMACGAVVVCTNEALRGTLPDELIAGESVESTAAALTAALSLDAAARVALTARLRAYVEREHSLALLAGRLAAILTK